MRIVVAGEEALQAVRVDGGYRTCNPEQQWRTEFDGRGFTTQPQSGDWRWIPGALVLVANWPYTLLVIQPTNAALKATDLARAGPQSRASIERWGSLHAGRTALGAVATLLYLWASLAA